MKYTRLTKQLVVAMSTAAIVAVITVPIVQNQHAESLHASAPQTEREESLSQVCAALCTNEAHAQELLDTFCNKSCVWYK